jgi:hypothetical protein
MSPATAPRHTTHSARRAQRLTGAITSALLEVATQVG